MFLSGIDLKKISDDVDKVSDLTTLVKKKLSTLYPRLLELQSGSGPRITKMYPYTLGEQIYYSDSVFSGQTNDT